MHSAEKRFLIPKYLQITSTFLSGRLYRPKKGDLPSAEDTNVPTNGGNEGDNWTNGQMDKWTSEQIDKRYMFDDESHQTRIMHHAS